MDKRKRNIISMVLLIILMISTLTSYAFADDKEIMTAIDNGHGEFKLINNNIDKFQAEKIELKKIDTDLYQITDSVVLQENEEYDKLIKVNNDTLLRVKELSIDLKNLNEIESIIEEYDVNPKMAEDIRNLSKSTKNDESMIDDTIILYTPKFSQGNDQSSISPLGLGYQSRYYYTGYLGYEYMDEIWYGKTVKRWETIETGYEVKDYINDVLNNFVNFIVGGVGDYATSGWYSLMEIFVGSPVVSYPASSGDVWQASLMENKWRKYTSIDLGDGDGYNTRATSERSRAYFLHYLNIGGKDDERSDNEESYTCDNYYDTDWLAYRYRDLGYSEYITSYSVNKFTYFQSLN